MPDGRSPTSGGCRMGAGCAKKSFDTGETVDAPACTEVAFTGIASAGHNVVRSALIMHASVLRSPSVDCATAAEAAWPSFVTYTLKLTVWGTGFRGATVL